MPWENNSGGPWGGGGGSGGGRGGGPRNPWGQGGGGGGGRGPQGPDVEDLVRQSQERLKRFLPGGGKNGMVIGLLAAIGVVVWLATGFYTVEPDEQGVELVFGKLADTTRPGLNYNFPAPIGEIMKPKVTNINQVEIGFRPRGSANQNVPEESLMLTGDENIIDVQFVVLWKIRDAGAFLFNVRNPEESVKNAAEAAMREIVGKTGFEVARTRGRTELAGQASERLQQILDSYGAGIEVLEVKPQKVDPPEAVIDAFRDVQAANADKERAINEATGYFNEVTQRAEGQAQQITLAAEAYKQERINQALGDAQRFTSVLQEYEKAEGITKRRIYLQTMEEILANMNKVLIEDGAGGESGVLPYLPLDRLTTGANRGGNQ